MTFGCRSPGCLPVGPDCCELSSGDAGASTAHAFDDRRSELVSCGHRPAQRSLILGRQFSVRNHAVVSSPRHDGIFASAAAVALKGVRWRQNDHLPAGGQEMATKSASAWWSS